MWNYIKRHPIKSMLQFLSGVGWMTLMGWVLPERAITVLMIGLGACLVWLLTVIKDYKE